MNHRRATSPRSLMIIGFLTATIIASSNVPVAATFLFVPGQYSTIQAAVNAASSGDDIVIAAGRFGGPITINNKDLRFWGAGRKSTVVYHNTTQQVIKIDASTVEFYGMELTGSDWSPGNLGGGVSSVIIFATSSNLRLANVHVNSCRNFCVRVHGGFLEVEDVILSQDTKQSSADQGFDLLWADAVIDRLEVPEGFIDHVIDVNFTTAPPPYPGARSYIEVTNSQFTISPYSYGDGIRLTRDVDAVIIDNQFVRAPQGSLTGSTKGVGVAGFGINAHLMGNVFRELPLGVLINGGQPANQVLLEFNSFEDIISTGVNLTQIVSPAAVDLGRGPFGGSGGNVFCRSTATSKGYDIQMALWSNVLVFAQDVTWSRPDPSDAVFDVLDDSSLGGEVIFQGGNYGPSYCGP